INDSDGLAAKGCITASVNGPPCSCGAKGIRAKRVDWAVGRADDRNRHIRVTNVHRSRRRKDDWIAALDDLIAPADQIGRSGIDDRQCLAASSAVTARVKRAPG